VSRVCRVRQRHDGVVEASAGGDGNLDAVAFPAGADSRAGRGRPWTHRRGRPRSRGRRPPGTQLTVRALKATDLTHSVWPVKVQRCWPVAGSHSRTVLSPPALPSNCTSGLNATDLTRSVWPV